VTEENGLLVAVRQQNAEMVELVESATDQEFGTPCEDHGGTTVAEVAAHCAEGYEMTAAWLQRLTARVAVPAAGEPAHDHSHPHPHPHPDEVGAAATAGPDRVATASRLRAGGEAIVAQIGSLSEKDLRIVPPASPFADGTSPLDATLLGLSAHLQEHLESMRRAIAGTRRG
jgi:DinB family protein